MLVRLPCLLSPPYESWCGWCWFFVRVAVRCVRVLSSRLSSNSVQLSPAPSISHSAVTLSRSHLSNNAVVYTGQSPKTNSTHEVNNTLAVVLCLVAIASSEVAPTWENICMSHPFLLAANFNTPECSQIKSGMAVVLRWYGVSSRR